MKCYPKPELGYVDCVNDDGEKQRHYYAGDTAPQPPRPLLGDRVEQVFRSIGITEDRWVEARRAVGLWPNTKGCGCKARKEFLNRAHAWWLRQRR